MAIDTSVVNINFEVIKSNTCKVLKVLDLSNWATFVDTPSYIQILTPGAANPVTHIFQKGKLNIFNSNNLGLSDVIDYSELAPLPDGIYTLTILQCEDDPNAVTKYFLQDCQIKCKIARKLISIDLSCAPCRKDIMNNIQDILMYLEGAQAQVDKCNVLKAMEYYQRAATLLDRISDSTTTECTNC